MPISLVPMTVRGVSGLDDRVLADSVRGQGLLIVAPEFDRAVLFSDPLVVQP